ncbi:unnamed protein product [Clonostachys rosea]|uniref:FAD-binding domain-containing protein n=1 Tax=Bionectria ochroleuca TaxID=29856 RepID=A0ABY6TSJ7_BIOOC|nr:unnamed protein product [Clonostachys rosea]
MGAPTRPCVVVVGGGPIGLTAAHIFSQAGIDFVVLEARDTVLPEVGASMNLYPGTMRVLHQLGLGEAAEAVSAKIVRAFFVDWDGQLYKKGHPGPVFDEIHGCHPLAFHRLDVLRVLYDNLKPADQKRVLTNKQVVDVQTTSEGVTALCADGTTYEGTFVLGVDGVNGKTRDFMRALTLQQSPDAKVNPEKPFTAYYRVMFGTIPIPPGMGVGENHDCHGAKYSTMLITGSQGRAWFFLYEELDTPTQERVRYTEQDMEELAARCKDMHISQDLTFGDIWPTVVKAGMTNLDEGMLERWSGDRIVVAGDAAHKITPNIGWGYFAGVQDVIALTNLLQASLSQGSAGSLSGEQLGKIFEEYEATRKPEMATVLNLSASATRQSAWPRTWSGLFYRFMEWVSTVPGFEYFTIKYIASPVQSNALVLNFLSCEEPYHGLVPWKYPTTRA